MREILFRGKLKNTGEWAFGNLNITIKGTNIITPDDTPIGKYGAVIPETVGQYTGLTDKNGTKIFEGDIVKEDDVTYNGATITKGGIFEIKMLEGCWLVVEHKVKDAAWHFLDTFAKTVEVIGNIHDNPELLKGGAE